MNFLLYKEKLDEWNTELMIESLCCGLNGTDTSIPDAVHRWGNPLSVGVFIATASKNGVGVVLDSLRTEWSLEFSKFLEQGFT